MIVTGSSAALLSREVATALRGRGWQVLIQPFSFDEALRHQRRAFPDDATALTGRERTRLEAPSSTGLGPAAFPRRKGSTRRRDISFCATTSTWRCCATWSSVTTCATWTSLRWLVRHLLGNAGGMFSIGKFHAALKSQGIPIAKDTFHQFLGYLEDGFLVRVVWMESASERQRMVNPRRSYPVDPG